MFVRRAPYFTPLFRPIRSNIRGAEVIERDPKSYILGTHCTKLMETLVMDLSTYLSHV